MNLRPPAPGWIRIARSSASSLAERNENLVDQSAQGGRFDRRLGGLDRAQYRISWFQLLGADDQLVEERQNRALHRARPPLFAQTRS